MLVVWTPPVQLQLQLPHIHLGGVPLSVFVAVHAAVTHSHTLALNSTLAVQAENVVHN